MPAPDRKGRATRTPEYIHPPLSVVIRLQPKGGLSACIRFDQKSGTKNPDLLSQIRILVVGVSLKDLWKSSNINGLQAASKAFILK